MNQALRVTEAIVAPLAHARGVALTVSDATRDAQVFGDDAKIKQVLVNLATNAVKFTGQGGQVTLTCRAANDDVVFDISDTGAGIPADQLRAIFEPYVQLPTPLLDSHGGSGLGLAISREFANGDARRAHGVEHARTRLDVHAAAQALLTRARSGHHQLAAAQQMLPVIPDTIGPRRQAPQEH